MAIQEATSFPQTGTLAAEEPATAAAETHHQIVWLAWR